MSRHRGRSRSITSSSRVPSQDEHAAWSGALCKCSNELHLRCARVVKAAAVISLVALTSSTNIDEWSAAREFLELNSDLIFRSLVVHRVSLENGASRHATSGAWCLGTATRIDTKDVGSSDDAVDVPLFDICSERFTDPQTIESKQRYQRVIPFRTDTSLDKEAAKFVAVQPEGA